MAVKVPNLRHALFRVLYIRLLQTRKIVAEVDSTKLGNWLAHATSSIALRFISIADA
jgi:hypothetical protein